MICEVQLLPTLIPSLKLVNAAAESCGLEFGNVLIYTCFKSCWDIDDTYRREQIYLEAEAGPF